VLEEARNRTAPVRIRVARAGPKAETPEARKVETAVAQWAGKALRPGVGVAMSNLGSAEAPLLKRTAPKKAGQVGLAVLRFPQLPLHTPRTPQRLRAPLCRISSRLFPQ